MHRSFVGDQRARNFRLFEDKGMDEGEKADRVGWLGLCRLSIPLLSFPVGSISLIQMMVVFYVDVCM